MTDIVITSARRTPVGAFNGAFATLPASDLGTAAIAAAVGDSGLDPAEPSEVVMGQILTAAQGMNPARQAAIRAGIPAAGAGLERQSGVRLGPARGSPSAAARSPAAMRRSWSPAARRA